MTDKHIYSRVTLFDMSPSIIVILILSCINTTKYLLLDTKVRGSLLRQRIGTNRLFSESGLKHMT